LIGNPNGHIGAAELANLLEESRRSAESLEAADVHPHMAACSTCREQFEGLASLDRQLESLRPVESGLAQGECPGSGVWREIAGGLKPNGETLACIEHASRCDYCGPLLRGAMAELADLNGEITAAERNHIATLVSASAEWQQTLVQRITGTQHSGPDRGSTTWWQRWRTVPRLAMVGASLLAVVGAGSWVVIQRNQPAHANRLLARAYTEKRTLELRIVGASYAPLRVSRGPAASFTRRPEALLEAEALIASQLASHPSDASWLRAQAQADVLEGKYDAAVEALRRALELEPHSPAILTDLATACFQRAQQEDRKEDFGEAFEYLSQVLKLHPDDAVALFNRTIVSEHLFLYQQALDDWEHYLGVDPASQWAEEARNRADAVREKLKEHGSLTPLLAPAQVATSANPGADAGQRSEVDQRIEEYLHEAVRSWLPQAFPASRANGDRSALQALFFLADLTSQQHGDRWLADLLHGSSAPQFPQAITALARAIQANDAGEFDASHRQAVSAEQLFRASGNMAGMLRAQFEESFAAQIERHSEECRQKATAAFTESERHSYPWLQIQLGLEKGVCSALMSDIDADERAAQVAMNQAEKSGYGTLYLRALGFFAGDKFATGDSSGGWRLANSGLERYWSGQFPDMRGYNLYDEVALAAGAAGHPNLQLASWREAVSVIDANEELLLRASAHSNMAAAASNANRPEVAEHHYGEATRLYALVPRNEAARAERIEIEIRTAQVEARQGAFDAALGRLTRIQDEVRLSDSYLAQMFYSALGEAQLRSHRAAEAEPAFRAALSLAERNLASLTSEAERTSWSKDAAPVYLGLAESELVQGHEQEALDAFEWYLGAPQRVGRGGRSTSKTAVEPLPSLPDPSRLPAQLPLLFNQTVLAYGVLPDGLAIWVYDNRGVSAKWIPKSAQELRDLSADFYAECSDPKSELSALRRDARSLYDALIAPVEQQLQPGRMLVIETEGWLARVPFEALLDSNDRYLIERAPIVHSLGQDSQARLRSDTGISGDLAALIVGSSASSPADGLIPLPDVAAEADAVASGFHSARVLKGGEATLSAIRNELPGAAIFHFAGHSLATPDRAGLMLDNANGQQGVPQLLDADLLRHIRLPNLQLALLSACSSASGSGGSSGFDSVTDAFLRAGVPHVVASRWAVDSAETRGFVADFYHNALSGHTVSDALWLTSRKMLANPRTSHPYYWSAFAAYGQP
jgi:CHAT domain-containing protein